MIANADEEKGIFSSLFPICESRQTNYLEE
jgi:hypothetical protein